MLLNSVTKIFFAILVAKENIKVDKLQGKAINAKKEVQKKRPLKRGKKQESSSEQSED